MIVQHELPELPLFLRFKLLDLIKQSRISTVASVPEKNLT